MLHLWLAGAHPRHRKKQIEANRRHAQKATGPKSEEGRRVSRLNACNHGLTGQILVMTGEHADVCQRFIPSVVDELRPVCVMEGLLAPLDSRWRTEAAAAMRSNLFAAGIRRAEHNSAEDSSTPGAQYDDIDRAFASVRSFLHGPRRVQLLAVCEMRLYRKGQSDLKQLRELQATRCAAERGVGAARGRSAGRKSPCRPTTN